MCVTPSMPYGAVIYWPVSFWGLLFASNHIVKVHHLPVRIGRKSDKFGLVNNTVLAHLQALKLLCYKEAVSISVSKHTQDNDIMV